MQELKTRILKQQVDLVLSLGNVCTPALWMKEFSVRSLASPLDWMMSYNLKVALNLIKSDFKDFFIDCENVKKINKEYLWVLDKKTQMVSIHHFYTNKDFNQQVIDFNAKSIYRWEKIKHKILESKSIALINVSDEKLEDIELFLIEFFNFFEQIKPFNRDIFFIHIKNDESKKFNEVCVNQYEVSNNLKIIQYVGNNVYISDNERLEAFKNEFIWDLMMKNLKFWNLESKNTYFEQLESKRIIDSSLEYKWGKALYESNKFLDFISLPFVLREIKKQHKKLNLDSINNEELKDSAFYKIGSILFQGKNFKKEQLKFGKNLSLSLSLLQAN